MAKQVTTALFAGYHQLSDDAQQPNQPPHDEFLRELGQLRIATPYAMPPRTARFPACLALNSGLVIMSKIEIVKSYDEVFGLSSESFNVNRGMLCARLVDGTFVVTAHVAPGPSASGKFAQTLIGGLVRLQRARQAYQLSAFIRRVVPPSAPLILAGDLNLSVSFESADGRGRWVLSSLICPVSLGRSWCVARQ